MSEDDGCTICMEPFKYPKMLPCRHTFCISCLLKYLHEFEEKSNFACPLCRESCFVPENGFGDFPTNYFTRTEKLAHQCQGCNINPSTKVCYICISSFCRKCAVSHSHFQKADDSKEPVNNLPLQLRIRFGEHMKTELICRQISKFYVNFSTAENERKNICSLACSRDGVYVNRGNSKHLLRYDVRGNITAQISLIDTSDVSTVLETRSGQLLVAHYLLKSVICYRDNMPSFKPFYFAKTPAFHPFGLSELLNCNIVICGPTHLCSRNCNRSDCELMKYCPGVIHILSQKGRLLRQIVKDGEEFIFKFPTCIASSSTSETFAVCDRRRRCVLVIDYSGHIRFIYTSPLQNTLFLPFLLPENELVLPLAVCSSLDGNYVIADPRAECLHVLNPFGRYIGILRSDTCETLEHTSAVCTDLENNIWLGHHNEGTVAIFKSKHYRNVFTQHSSNFQQEFLLPDTESIENFSSSSDDD